MFTLDPFNGRLVWRGAQFTIRDLLWATTVVCLLLTIWIRTPPAELQRLKGWRFGPLPANTYGWGGVVPNDHSGEGFYFADFRGDHVIREGDKQRIEASEVRYFNNDLRPPVWRGPQ